VQRCGECGYDFHEDLFHLAERCVVFSTDLRGVLHGNALDTLLRRPDPRTWSPLEYVAHVSEVIPWYVARVHTVLRDSATQLEAFDWDLAASAGQYRQRDVEAVASDLEQACSALAQVARSVTGDDLARVGTGSDGTPRTVATLLARAGHELAHHELDIRHGVEAAASAERAR
jgi:hypothetical protein